MKKVLENVGNVWQGGAHVRIYLDRAAINKLLGLKVEVYNTGRISAAWLDGEKISNSSADLMITATDKVYYDVVAEKFVVKLDWGSPSTRKYGEQLEAEFNSLTVEEVSKKLGI
ncbi:MAG TPA: hypothetical protein VFC76_00990 [Oscillospiraceae bacterium]|nr:hypothetical protein [Oscillospiraceae bacterium]